MADFTDDDDALLAELGVEVEAKRVGSRTPQQERIIAGFEDIQRFVGLCCTNRVTDGPPLSPDRLIPRLQ